MPAKNAHDREKFYYEYLAKQVLERIYSDRYGTLDLSDKPDLKSRIGNNVEVTRATYSNEGKMTGLFRMVRNNPVNSISPKLDNVIKQKGYHLIDYKGVVIGYGPNEGVWASPNELIAATDNKIEKLYSYGGKTDLFVYTPLMGDNDDISVLRDYFDWCNSARGVSDDWFRHIYIFDYQSICDFDFDNEEMLIVRIEKQIIDAMVREAKKQIKTLEISRT